MAAATGGSIAISGCPSCSYFSQKTRSSASTLPLVMNQRRSKTCFAARESSTSTVEPVAAETEAKKVGAKTTEKQEAEGGAAPPPSKPKPAAKAPTKALPQLMEEDVIPSLRATLQSQQDISQLQLFFQENKLEGSFLKKGNPYAFWAFFPDGTINGPKGFSVSSYGAGASTVEPFLVDEKKPTAKHVVFWVEKRLAAQGIIPVWKE